MVTVRSESFTLSQKPHVYVAATDSVVFFLRVDNSEIWLSINDEGHW